MFDALGFEDNKIKQYTVGTALDLRQRIQKNAQVINMCMYVPVNTFAEAEDGIEVIQRLIFTHLTIRPSLSS